ncbi:MAG: hypothetical protein AAF414_14895 [Pseudomonadota bacterium]
MIDHLLSSLEESQPPADLTPPLQALWWLKKGNLAVGPEWERAHGICQSGEDEKAFDWIHALAHWIEGDESNANYWYRRVGETRSGASTDEEWRHLVTALSQ